jgi:putative polyketide hydroxylase
MSPTAPVLIVGAGLTGLTAAILLSWRGVPCILVERRSSTSRHPRARGINLRTLELLHGVPGLVEDLCNAAPVSADFSIIIAESVTGPVMQTLLAPGDFDTGALSPSPMCTAGQDRLEPVLLSHARKFGADIRFGTELVSFSQDDQGVRAVLRDRETGAQSSITAQYMIAADGNRSPVRAALGMATQGQGVLSNNMSMLFRADMSDITGGKGFLLYYLRNPKFIGAFVTSDDPDIGQISVEYDPARETAADYTPARCVEMVRAAMGVSDISVEILDVMPWEMSAQLAERMRQGRVFLAGDAAHTMPPTGGLGGQTGMQDAADLAWKLAMVLQGQAGSALLDTYETERHPVAALTVARQTANYAERLRPDRKDLAKSSDGNDYISVALGYRYRSSAVLIDGTDTGAQAESPFAQNGSPGTRLPHVALQRDNETISSLGLIDKDFVLFAGAAATDWLAAAELVTKTLGAPITVIVLGQDVNDRIGAFSGRVGIGTTGALLVRPDGFVAWRAVGPHEDAPAILAAVLGHILSQRIELHEDAA